MKSFAEREAAGELREYFLGERVLVTGGAGYLGSHLVRRLASLGAEVRVLDDLSSGTRENIPYGLADLRVDSILDARALERAVRQCRYVFHLAAMVDVAETIRRPERCYAVNATGTLRVLEACRREGVRRLVVASSATVYGASPAVPCEESALVDAWTPHATSKGAAELMVASAARCHRLGAVALRYFNVYGGSDQRRGSVVSEVVRSALEGEPPRLFGNGQQERDFIHVDDAVDGTLAAAISEISGEVVNLGTGEGTSLRRLCELVARETQTSRRPEYELARGTEPERLVADTSKAHELLGFEARVSLIEGLRRTLRLFSEAHAA